MKERKRIKGRRQSGVRGTAKRLQASASQGKRRPALPEEWSKFYKPIKKPVTLRLDADIIAWFQRQGRGYQTRINHALRTVMMAERK